VAASRTASRTRKKEDEEKKPPAEVPAAAAAAGSAPATAVATASQVHRLVKVQKSGVAAAPATEQFTAQGSSSAAAAPAADPMRSKAKRKEPPAATGAKEASAAKKARCNGRAKKGTVAAGDAAIQASAVATPAPPLERHLAQVVLYAASDDVTLAFVAFNAHEDAQTTKGREKDPQRPKLCLTMEGKKPVVQLPIGEGEGEMGEIITVMFLFVREGITLPKITFVQSCMHWHVGGCTGDVAMTAGPPVSSGAAAAAAALPALSDAAAAAAATATVNPVLARTANSTPADSSGHCNVVPNAHLRMRFWLQEVSASSNWTVEPLPKLVAEPAAATTAAAATAAAAAVPSTVPGHNVGGKREQSLGAGSKASGGGARPAAKTQKPNAKKGASITTGAANHTLSAAAASESAASKTSSAATAQQLNESMKPPDTVDSDEDSSGYSSDAESTSSDLPLDNAAAHTALSPQVHLGMSIPENSARDGNSSDNSGSSAASASGSASRILPGDLDEWLEVHDLSSSAIIRQR